MLIRIRAKNQDSRDVPLEAADAFAKTSSERFASGTTTPTARHPAPTKASVFARSRPCSYASHSRGRRARAESRPRGRLSRGRARTRTRPRLLFPANLLIESTAKFARVRRTPVSDAASTPSTFVSPATSGIPLGIDVDGPPLAWSESRFAGRSVFDVARVSRGRRSRWLVPLALFRSVSSGARARTRHRDARATLEDDDRLVAPRASRVFRARALARLDERERARRPSELRSGSFVAVEISAGSVALGADFRLEKRGDAGNKYTGGAGAASACRRRPARVVDVQRVSSTSIAPFDTTPTPPPPPRLLPPASPTSPSPPFSPFPPQQPRPRSPPPPPLVLNHARHDQPVRLRRRRRVQDRRVADRRPGQVLGLRALPPTPPRRHVLREGSKGTAAREGRPLVEALASVGKSAAEHQTVTLVADLLVLRG